MAFLSWLIETLLQWYVWLPIVILLAYLTWRNYRQVDAVKSIQSVLLTLEIPKSNSKGAATAEQLFASLHGILRDRTELRKNGGIQEHLSFEMAAFDGQLHIYLWVPKSLQSFVEGQINAQYPNVEIRQAAEDYVAHERHHHVVCVSEFSLTDAQYLPIKSYGSLEVDPLTSIVSTLTKLESANEETWIQVLVKPLADDWHSGAKSWVNGIKNGNPFDFLTGGGGGLNFQWFGDLFGAFWKPPQGGGSTARTLSEREKTRIAAAEQKATKIGYKVRIRLVYLGSSQVNAKQRMQAVAGTFKQFNNMNINGLKLGTTSYKKEDLSRYKSRLFMNGGFILNIEELATIFHLPHSGLNSSNIAWLNEVVDEPKPNLPIITGNTAIDENISAFGLINFQGINHQFGLLRSDRSRHVYIIGQTGAGKSATLELLALSDIFHGQGYAIIDPHGDFAMGNLRFVPGSRLEDVVYFNPADTAWPLGFNPLEVINPAQKSNVSSELIGVFKRMFGDSWGPRLEYILRYTILALLDRPQTTMLDITRMLTDKQFRNETLGYCNDTVVLQFWQVEFASWNDKFQSEAIAPVLNKVGAFTANPVIRNIIGQPKSTFNIREMMDNGKILVVNLSKGLIGEDNAAILGSLLVTKIQLAAMSRSDIPTIDDRRSFYLYVDEFQNFATDSFATILSEARKYGLNLTVANQYISQMTPSVRDAVFGNVGTLISFRVSGDDGSLLAKQFEPQFTSGDLVQLDNRHFISSMVVDGERIPAFSAMTLELPAAEMDNINHIIEYTRQNYARSRVEVEAEISANLQPARSQATPRPTHAYPPAVLSAPQQTLAPLQPPGVPRVTSLVTDAASASHSKRKRPRSRKKKDAQVSAETPQSVTPNTTPGVPAPAPSQRTSVLFDPTRLRVHHNRGVANAQPQSQPAAPVEQPTPQPKPVTQPLPSPQKQHDETILRVRR